MLEWFSSTNEPSAPPLLGSLTMNIKRITHKNPSGGVIRKAHFQLLNALATLDPTMYLES